MKLLSSVLLAMAALVLLIHDTAWTADDEEPLGWYLDADLAGVWTGGNSESNTLGLGAKLRRLWARSEIIVTGGATQTRSSLIRRTATGTATDFVVNEDKVSETTAELYYVRGWYQYDLSPKFFTFGGVDWLKNRFAGIDSRFLVALGAGNTWSSIDNLKFKTFYSFTYTFQEDIVDNPFVKSKFPGIRIGYDLDYRLTPSTRFQSVLAADWNLDNTDDVRLNWFNALPISISSKLELKPSLQLLWRNEPSLTVVPLLDTGGSDTGEKVATPLGKLDSIFTLALVVKLGPETP